MSPETAIRVNYEYIDDHHVFTSKDVQGLLVVHRDAKTAIDDVAVSIQHLLELNEGIKCQVSPLKPFNDFLQEKRKPVKEIESYGLRLANQSYAISACV